MSTLNVTNISDGTNTTSTTDVVKGSARAWVNFNGTGTVAIRSQYNVSSIDDNGTGKYTINFTTALTDTDYVIAGSSSDTGKTLVRVISGPVSGHSTRTTSAVAVCSYRPDNGSFDDQDFVEIVIFR